MCISTSCSNFRSFFSLSFESSVVVLSISVMFHIFHSTKRRHSTTLPTRDTPACPEKMKSTGLTLWMLFTTVSREEWNTTLELCSWFCLDPWNPSPPRLKSKPVVGISKDWMTAERVYILCDGDIVEISGWLGWLGSSEGDLLAVRRKQMWRAATLFNYKIAPDLFDIHLFCTHHSFVWLYPIDIHGCDIGFTQVSLLKLRLKEQHRLGFRVHEIFIYFSALSRSFPQANYCKSSEHKKAAIDQATAGLKKSQKTEVHI